MGTHCLLCKIELSNGFVLSNGSEIHNSCLINIQNKVKEINKEINNNILRIKNAEAICKKKSIESNSLSYILKSILGLAEKITFYEYQIIENNKQENEKLKRKIIALEEDLAIIYDYWPTYPPDWENRRKKLIAIQGKSCNRCSNNFQHIHHSISISDGGNHKLSNLELLCVNCHSRLHHRNLDTEDTYEYYSGNDFSEKVKFIKNAINERRPISFNYTKYEGEKCFRTIIPNKFQEFGRYDATCVVGHCNLRNAERAFRISRMKNISIK